MGPRNIENPGEASTENRVADAATRRKSKNVQQESEVTRKNLVGIVDRFLVRFCGAPLREVIESNYRIVCRAREDAIEIITVFDGHRRIPEDDLPRVKKR